MPRPVRLLIFSLLILILLAFLFFLKRSFLAVTRIIDGDTVVLSDGTHLRLIGFSAPEIGDCYSREAADALSKIVLNKWVRVEADRSPLDIYGRNLGYLFAGNVFINERLLEEGMGEFMMDVNNKKYENRLINAAESARVNRSGRWSTCADSSYGICLIKGNNDRNDKRYYHLPGFRHYSQTTIRLDLGDRWFCSRSEAEKAGFIPARE